jgi:hypothetical protein
MWRGLKVLLLAVAMCGLGLGVATAQETAQGEQNFKQIKLTGKLIESYISAQKDMADFARQNQAQPTDKPDPKIQAQLDELAQKHGFAGFAEFDDVAFNVSMVMAGLDPQTGNFTDPIAEIKQEMEDIRVDKSIAEKDRKQMLDELSEALKNTPPLQYPENVEMVKQYRERIEKVLQ